MTVAFSQQRVFDGNGNGRRTVVWELYSYDYTEGNLCLEKQPNDFFFCCRLVPTSGKQALDDDALGGGFGMESLKKRERGVRRSLGEGEEASLLLLFAC